jgi:hypothetical protein
VRTLQIRAADAAVRVLLPPIERIAGTPDSRRSRFVLLGLYLGAIAIAIGIGFFAASRRRKASSDEKRRELLDFTSPHLRSNVADMLQGLGYRGIARIDVPGYGQPDFRCRDNQNQSLVVQCAIQRSAGAVGLVEMQAFVERLATDHQGERGLYVTTADFTSQAIDLAREHNIELVDGVKLAQTIHR